MAWYDGLFSSDSGLNDQDKAKLANQGLLQAGLGILAANGRPGTTHFQALAGGLLGGLGSVQQGTQDIQNNRYKSAIEQSTLANMQASQLKAQQESAQKKALHDALAANTDAQGNVDTVKAIQQYGKSYPEDAASAFIALHGGKPDTKDSSQGALQIYPDGYNAFLQAGGTPQAAPQMAAQPSPMPSSIPAPMGAPGGASAYTPPPPMITPVGFDANVASVLGREGGYVQNDAGAGPTNYGINQRANPGVNVQGLTQDQARGIYRNKYWNAIGADNLPPALQAAAFDTAVNQGPGVAQQLISQSGGDVNRFAALRQQQYDNLVQQNPAKYGQFADSWAQRNAQTAGLPQGANPSQLPQGRISLQMPSKTANADDEKYAKLISFGVPQAAALEAAYGVKPQTVTNSQPPSYDPDQPTGDEYLNSLPAGRKAAVQSIVEGRQELPKGFSLKSPAGYQLMQDVVQADPTFDATNYGARANAMKQFTSATSPNAPANQIRSVQTIANHLSSMVNNLPKLDLGSFGVLNKYGNAFNTAQGKTDPDKTRALGAYDQDAKSIADETAKLFAGTGSALADREHVAAMLSRDQPVEKLQGSLGELSTLVGGRLEALDNQANTALGPRAASALNILTPEQRQVLAGVQTMAQTGKYTGPVIDTSLNKAKSIASSPKPNAGWSIQQVGN